jgi:hypothetical protein
LYSVSDYPKNIFQAIVAWEARESGDITKVEKEKVHKREVSMQAKVEGTKLEKGRPQEQVVFRQFKQAFRAPKWACEDCEI